MVYIARNCRESSWSRHGKIAIANRRSLLIVAHRKKTLRFLHFIWCFSPIWLTGLKVIDQMMTIRLDAKTFFLSRKQKVSPNWWRKTWRCKYSKTPRPLHEHCMEKEGYNSLHVNNFLSSSSLFVGSQYRKVGGAFERRLVNVARADSAERFAGRRGKEVVCRARKGAHLSRTSTASCAQIPTSPHLQKICKKKKNHFLP